MSRKKQSLSLQQIVTALTEIVDEAMAYQERKLEIERLLNVQPDIKVYSVGELLGADFNLAHAQSFIENPVYLSLRNGAKEIGRLIDKYFENVSLPDIAEEVCGDDEETWDYRMSFLSNAFDGIGGWAT